MKETREEKQYRADVLRKEAFDLDWEAASMDDDKPPRELHPILEGFFFLVSLIAAMATLGIVALMFLSLGQF